MCWWRREPPVPPTKSRTAPFLIPRAAHIRTFPQCSSSSSASALIAGVRRPCRREDDPRPDLRRRQGMRGHGGHRARRQGKRRPQSRWGTPGPCVLEGPSKPQRGPRLCSTLGGHRFGGPSVAAPLSGKDFCGRTSVRHRTADFSWTFPSTQAPRWSSAARTARRWRRRLSRASSPSKRRAATSWCETSPTSRCISSAPRSSAHDVSCIPHRCRRC